MKIPKICPRCKTLPIGCFADGGRFMFMGCPDCGTQTRMVHLGDPAKGNYYQKVTRLSDLAVALWNRKVALQHA